MKFIDKLKNLNYEKEFNWSIIDRWPTYPSYVKAVATKIQRALNNVPEAIRNEVFLMFFRSFYSTTCSTSRRSIPIRSFSNCCGCNGVFKY